MITANLIVRGIDVLTAMGIEFRVAGGDGAALFTLDVVVIVNRALLFRILPNVVVVDIGKRFDFVVDDRAPGEGTAREEMKLLKYWIIRRLNSFPPVFFSSGGEP